MTEFQPTEARSADPATPREASAANADPAKIETAKSDPAKTDQPKAESTIAASSWWGVCLATASTVFLAELGDKTQLAALLLSAESGRPGIVFLGASLALISSSLVGVLLGRWLSRVLPPQQLERLAGILMIGLGLWLGRQAAMTMLPLA